MVHSRTCCAGLEIAVASERSWDWMGWVVHVTQFILMEVFKHQVTSTAHPIPGSV